jgi:hypothetical protein
MDLLETLSVLRYSPRDPLRPLGRLDKEPSIAIDARAIPIIVARRRPDSNRTDRDRCRRLGLMRTYQLSWVCQSFRG